MGGFRFVCMVLFDMDVCCIWEKRFERSYGGVEMIGVVCWVFICGFLCYICVCLVE